MAICMVRGSGVPEGTVEERARIRLVVFMFCCTPKGIAANKCLFFLLAFLYFILIKISTKLSSAPYRLSVLKSQCQ